MQVAIREFKARLSHYLELARKGIILEITSHRQVVAHVSGVPDAVPPKLAELVARGALQWAEGKPQGAHLSLCDTGTPVSRMVLEDRG